MHISVEAQGGVAEYHSRDSEHSCDLETWGQLLSVSGPQLIIMKGQAS